MTLSPLFQKDGEGAKKKKGVGGGGGRERNVTYLLVVLVVDFHYLGFNYDFCVIFIPFFDIINFQ